MDDTVGRSERDEPGYENHPRLELDQLLTQLIGRAEDVLAAQDRLRGLLAANRSIIGDLALPVVLHRIIEAARQLVHARYGAIGVLSAAGGLEEFIYVGIDDDTAEHIGHLPAGKGLLGALIDDPHSIRLRRMADDPRSVGFPDHHPAMSSFLGVPIRVRDTVFGNLYLTERSGGPFSAEDEELVTALAATAGVAIENARLYEASRRRQQWLQAATQTTRQLLSDEGEDPLSLIARQVRELADSDVVTVVLPAGDGRRLVVAVAAGEGADVLTGMTYPVENSLVGLAFDTRQPVLLADVSHDPVHAVHLTAAVEVSAVMVLPLVGSSRTHGALMVGRVHGRPRYDEFDLDMAMMFANHAALALELSAAREDRQRMAVLEDRERIARDLHDHVIQRLFAAGLTLHSVAAGLPDAKLVERLSRVVSDNDDTIRQIRTSIFQLRGPVDPTGKDVRSRLLAVAAEEVAVLGFAPSVRFSGPIDALVSDRVADDLVAVTREAMSNAGRHGHATQVTVTLTADVTDGMLTLLITDDGIGVSSSGRRSGLANLSSRAAQYGGTLTIESPTAGDGEQQRGTQLRWAIPLT